jgi:hypothetical protein
MLPPGPRHCRGMRVMVQLRHTRALVPEPFPPAFTLDGEYEPVMVPVPLPDEPGANRFALAQPLDFSVEPEEATYVVRGEVADAELDQAVQALTLSNPDVIGVFSDPVIERCICPQRAIGTHEDVARALGVRALRNRGLNGRGVPVAVVDSGINRAHLVNRGQDPRVKAHPELREALVRRYGERMRFFQTG